MAKLLLLLRASGNETLEGVLAQRLEAEVGAGLNGSVQLLRALANDPFSDPDAPLPAPDWVVECVLRAGEPLAGLLEPLRHALARLPIASDSLLLAMHARHYREAQSARVHYYQLMFGNEGWSRADYLDYYTRFHCRMGFETPRIEGYVQNYVDAQASQELASMLGVSTVDAVSVSELIMEDPLEMLSHPDIAELAGAAAADEARFLDRSRNLAFCAEAALQLGDVNAAAEPAFAQHYPA